MKQVFDDHKIKPAMEVLKRVRRFGKNLPKDVFYLDTYQNCREAGFCIRGMYFLHDKNHKALAFNGGDLYISFSESRNSDNIIVQTDDTVSSTDSGGDKSLFVDFHGNIPTEEAYRNRVSFEPGCYDQAAKHIVKILEDYIRRAKAVAKHRHDAFLLEGKVA